MSVNVHRTIPLLFAAILTMNGCTDDRSATPSTDNTAKGNAESAETAKVVLGIQNYFVSEGDYDEAKTYDDPDAEFIKQRFMEANWNDPNVRPSFRLVRPLEDGGLLMMDVGRDQSETGEFQVGWAGRVDGQYRSGKSTKIDSPKKLLEMLLAFLNDDPNLINLIEWDDLE